MRNFRIIFTGIKIAIPIRNLDALNNVHATRVVDINGLNQTLYGSGIGTPSI